MADYMQHPDGVKRGSFHVSYALPRAGVRDDGQLIAGAKGPRLLDHLLCINHEDSAGYLHDGEGKEFAVLDLETGEKALFERPDSLTNHEQITAMVQSTFNATAFRVSARLWIV
jgi:hypothetical protein